MPLYEYRCKACGHRFEKIQSFSAPDEKECPVCQAEVERLISAPAVHFSGSGFYSTDYPSKSSGAPKSEGGSKDSGSKDSASAATDGGKASSTAAGEGSKTSSGSGGAPPAAPAANSAPASGSSKP